MEQVRAGKGVSSGSEYIDQKGKTRAADLKISSSMSDTAYARKGKKEVEDHIEIADTISP
jgi:hypothetical protein